jgi:hypothetical protein
VEEVSVLLEFRDNQLYSLFSGGLVDGGHIVGFTPDSQQLITSRREPHLVSGFHWVRFGNLGKHVFPGVTRNVDLDPEVGFGCHFAPDGKTFRATKPFWDQPRTFTALEVQTVDAGTGRLVKTVLKVDAASYDISANGKRLVTIDKGATNVTVYDLDRGTKLSEYSVPINKELEELHISGRDQFAANGWPGGPAGRGLERQPEPVVAISPDGTRVMLSRRIGQTILLDADTGKALPALEGTSSAFLSRGTGPFSADGHLLAAPAERFELVTLPAGKGIKKKEDVKAWQRDGSFLAIWDTQTGKALKTWKGTAGITIHPTRPLVVIVEVNGGTKSRVGLWDFSAEGEKK